jgi:hypothetical protein
MPFDCRRLALSDFDFSVNVRIDIRARHFNFHLSGLADLHLTLLDQPVAFSNLSVAGDGFALAAQRFAFGADGSAFNDQFFAVAHQFALLLPKLAFKYDAISFGLWTARFRMRPATRDAGHQRTGEKQ